MQNRGDSYFWLLDDSSVVLWGSGGPILGTSGTLSSGWIWPRTSSFFSGDRLKLLVGSMKLLRILLISSVRNSSSLCLTYSCCSFYLITASRSDIKKTECMDIVSLPVCSEAFTMANFSSRASRSFNLPSRSFFCNSSSSCF